MRGQAYTLEAITASLLLIGGLVFALQATGVTPLSASTSSQHIENQQAAAGEGALAVAIERDAARVAVLNWNSTSDGFYGASERYFVDKAPTNTFGAILNRTYEPRGIVFNVYVVYERTDGDRTRERLLFRGQPSDNAVSVSATVTLYDDDALYNDSQEPVVVTDESHTYDATSETTALDEAPVVPYTVHGVVDDSGDTYARGTDYAVIDNDGDGKLDTLDWSVGGASPDDGETFTVDYTPAVSGSRFYAPDARSDSGVYNVVTVEVIAWRQ